MLEHNNTAAIAERIEGLAADLVVRDDLVSDREAWSLSLLSLADFARSCGCEHIAGLAERVAAAISDETATAAGDIASRVEDAVEQLRGALIELPAESSAPAPSNFTLASLAQDPELVGDFVVESREHLESIEGNLLALEQDSSGTEPVHAIFRSFHTIKGLAGFLEFASIQEVAHEVETVLDRVRQGQLRITPLAIDVILASRDYIGRWLKLLDHGPASSIPADLTANAELIRRIRSLEDPKEESQLPAVAASAQETEHEPLDSRAATATRSGPRSVKVDTDKLDYLVDMVGEMVIAQSLVRHDPELVVLKNPRVARNLSQLARIADEVQRTAMAMRMVPIGPLFQKMARLVRDLSRRFGKQITFETEGEDVEIDRNIVEELADPLMHMIRNAVDHGIETSAERMAAGKPPAARVKLRACHRSGQIVIEVTDDGRGISRARVLEKARSKGLVAPTAILSDSDCLNLIFHPGFSTAESISDISGRGVGMDVVRKQIQRLRGSVDIESVEGSGTTFSLRLPLTLAIIDGLVVAVGEERYIVPINGVIEMLRPAPGLVSTVENRAEVVTVRDRLLPVVRLYKRFGITPRSTDPTEAVLIVADVDGASFCLMVDDLIGKQEVVIKSLGPVFEHVGGIAGGAILGDGHIGLILDLKGVFGSKSDV